MLLSTLILFLLSPAWAQITVYTGSRVRPTTTTSLAPSVSYTGLPAYDPLSLTAPAPPSPAVTGASISIPANAAAIASQNLTLSKPQKGNFLGFSIELSVADVLLGKNGKQLKPEFLNYMANVQNRAGAGPIIRVGGNTQDNSTIEMDLPNGAIIQKIKTSTQVTNTPNINYSPGLLYVMSNISSLVQAEWFFGLAFNYSDVQINSKNIPLAAQYAQNILGNNLRGLVVGNEPDLYVDHGDRPADWTVQNYMSEFSEITTSAATNLPNQVAFVGPSVCCERTGFEFQDLVSAGWLSQNQNHLAAVSVQHYPTNNCQLNGNILNPQDLFPQFLNHTSAMALTAPYIPNAQEAMAVGKDMIMMEMNTASCGGFPGLSDSFGAAMWLVDWTLQLATANFSAALMHVGGQNVYYNPFTPPPSNMSQIYEWTTGSVYYSTLVVAETFGRSNTSQIIDITPSDAIYWPRYAIYENDTPTRLLLFNYVSDPSGQSTYQAAITVPGNPSTVTVRYFSALSVSEQYNITWAGQTMGTSFDSDGRLKGNESTTTINCNTGGNNGAGECIIPVYAPSIALVFLTNQALKDSSIPVSATASYATTVIGTGSATIDPKVLETSNGQNGPDGEVGKNSKGGNNSGASGRFSFSAGMVFLGVVISRTFI